MFYYLASLFFSSNAVQPTLERFLILTLIRCLAFGILETSYLSFLSYQESKKKEIIFTTVEQFILNLSFLPMFEYFFGLIFPQEYTLFCTLSYPVLYWSIEIVEHSFMLLFYGENRAWKYTGFDVMFDGAIKLLYFPIWIIVGLMDSILPRY